MKISTGVDGLVIVTGFCEIIIFFPALKYNSQQDGSSL